MAFDLKDVVSSEVISSLLNGNYSLLLGAGASYGACSSDGRRLPMGDEFSKELISGLGLKVRDGTQLQHVWDAAIHKIGSEDELRKKYLAPRFTNCRFSKSQLEYANFAWKRIYTFNVDDSLSRAYQSSKEGLQLLDEVHFEDPFFESELVNDRTQLVYLHGAATLKDRRVVFSPPSYASAIKEQHTWFHVFADEFLSSPFIVIGASLREPDFETYLSQKARYFTPLAPKSLYVDPNIDDSARAICARLGLEPIEMTGEAFFTQLADLVRPREKISTRLARDLKPLALIKAIGPYAAKIAHQFFLVPRALDKWDQVERPAEQFYEGFEPEWDDILKGRDVRLGYEASIIQDVRRFQDTTTDDRFKVAVISDNAGTGKTTAAMRIGAELANEGRAVLYFKGPDRLDESALLNIIEREKSPLVLVIDHFIDSSIPISRLIEEFPAKGAKCFVLGIERRTHESLLRERLRNAKASFLEVPRLGAKEAADLAAKMRVAGKLGEYSGETDEVLAKKFVAVDGRAWAGQMLAILLDVTQKEQLTKRLRGEWSSLPSVAKRFYGAVCVASACGFPIRSARVFAACNSMASSNEVKAAIEGPLKGLVRWSYEGGEAFVKPRHRVIGEEIVRECMTQDEVFDCSLSVSISLAAYVNVKTIIKGTPDARLLAQIMNEDGRVIPRFKPRAEEWFSKLQPSFDWNSRFWEQRALHSMKVGNLGRARDFASTAVGIEKKHVQPLTTYARILLESADRDTSIRLDERIGLFRQAVEILDEVVGSPQASRRLDVHPFHLLFDVSVKVGAKIVGGGVADFHRDVLRRHAPTVGRDFTHSSELVGALKALRIAKII